MFDSERLNRAQSNFFLEYPGGFNDPRIQAVVKKHRADKMTAMAREYFSPEACSNALVTADHMVKVVSRSSMVSLFEKPKFRDFVNRLNQDEKAYLVNALSQFLHGRTQAIQQAGFEALTDILRTEKLAKWSLLTIIPAYYWPTKEVFVKPTTAKNILRYFELDNPVYKPAPTWAFYKAYRRLINDGRRRVDKRLAPSNAAFSGFLMMAAKP